MGVKYGMAAVKMQEAADTIEELSDLCANQSKDCSEAIAKYIELWERQPHWIPCSERLPNKNGRYLVTRGLNAAGALWNRVYIANYSDLMGLKREKIFWDGNVGKSDFKRLEDVIAWMPLAEPYKEE